MKPSSGVLVQAYEHKLPKAEIYLFNVEWLPRKQTKIILSFLRLHSSTAFQTHFVEYSNEYSELISFKIDWFDLLAVQGTLKSLLHTTVQKHQFFSAQLSL